MAQVAGRRSSVVEGGGEEGRKEVSGMSFPKREPTNKEWWGEKRPPRTQKETMANHSYFNHLAMVTEKRARKKWFYTQLCAEP